MGLDFQNVPLSFGQGLDTKDDPKQLVPGKLTTLENGKFNIGKEINKREGFTALTKSIFGEGGTVSSGVMVQAYQDELLEASGFSLYSYNNSVPNWINKGTLVTTKLESSTVIRTTTNQVLPDSALNGNLQCFTWYDSTLSQLSYTLYDTLTRQSIVNNGILSATGSVAKTLALGSNFVMLYYESGSLKYKTINTATPQTLSSATTIASDINTNALFDATVFNSRIYIAYASSSARVSMYYLDSSLVLSTRLDVGSVTPNKAITVFGDASNNAWVGYGTASTVAAFVANPNLTTTTLATTTIDSATIANIVGVVSGTLGTFYYEVVGTNTLAGDPNNFIKLDILSIGGANSGGAVLIRDVGLASKVFTISGVNYFWSTKQSTLQSTYFLLNSGAKVIAKLSQGLGGGYTTRAILPEVNNVATNRYQTATLVKDLLVSVGGVQSTQTGVQSATIEFIQDTVPNIVLGENSMIGGGIVNMYDGANVVEHGYNVYPEGMTVTQTTSANSTVTVGHVLSGTVFGAGTASSVGTSSIQYSAVYEWTDNQGQNHRSAPSIPVTLSAAAMGVVGTFTGTMAGATAIITGVNNAPAVAPGQYVTFIDAVNFTNPKANATVSTVSTNSVTLSRSHSGTGTINGATFIVTNLPIGFITGVTSATAGSNTLTANGGNYDNLGIGAVLFSKGTSDTGTSEADIIPQGTYITAISQAGGTTGGDVTITISNPIKYATSTGSFFYTTDVSTGRIVVPTLRLTSKSRAVIAVYKTEVNGTVFYLTTSPTNPTYNTTSVDTVTIVDNTPDAILIGNNQLYTTGGELENIAAPASDILVSFKSRAIAIPSEDKLSWWYSKQVIPGQPVEFSDQFVNNVNSNIGNITAVGTLDEKIIFFGPSSKYFVVGDGPAPSGVNNDYSQAQHITGSTGCENQNSILEIPIGIIYQDPTKGIYLLDRSLSEQFIGKDVQQYNDDPVTSAQLIPESTSLKLTLTSGAVLLYDWFYGQWGTDPHATEAISSTLFDESYVYVQSDGLVLQETFDTFTDNRQYYALKMKTGWISFAGVQGYQRVCQLLILGQYKSPHTLNVNVYAGLDDVNIKQTFTIPVTSDPGNYEYRLFFNDQVQKSTSIRLEIYDSNQSGTGESVSLSNLSFRVGAKKGLNKLEAARSY